MPSGDRKTDESGKLQSLASVVKGNLTDYVGYFFSVSLLFLYLVIRLSMVYIVTFSCVNITC